MQIDFVNGYSSIDKNLGEKVPGCDSHQINSLLNK